MTEREFANKIFDASLAEALYHFVDEKCYDDFCDKCIERDLSLAEYVYEYKSQSFKAYCIENGYLGQ